MDNIHGFRKGSFAQWMGHSGIYCNHGDVVEVTDVGASTITYVCDDGYVTTM